MLVERKATIRLQQDLVMRDDHIRGFRRPHLMRGLPDDLLARNADIVHAGLVDQYIAPVMDAFHDDRRGSGIDDLVQELTISIALLREPSLLRNVLERGAPSAV